MNNNLYKFASWVVIMELDFSLVNKEVVGLRMYPGSSGHHRLKRLTFEELIFPYIAKATTYEQVCAKVREARSKIDLSAEGYVYEDIDRPTELIACLALEREAMSNAMNLIGNNYLRGEPTQGESEIKT